MPLENSSSIPAMFASVYTAPPPEVLYDMYENDLTFDEASKNLLDKELDAGWNTDLMDEMMAGGAGELGGLDDDDVEKAIYQISVSQKNGTDPAGITTPYGPGLSQEELDQIIGEFPGINAGVEWREMDEHMFDAENILQDPRTNEAIDGMMDEGVRRAEDEGGIDSLGDIFKSFGEQLGNAGQRVVDTMFGALNPQTAYAAEISEGDGDPSTDAWMVQYLGNKGDNTIANTADGIKKNFAEKKITPSPDGSDGMDGEPSGAGELDPNEEAAQIYEGLLAKGTTLEKLLEGLKDVGDADFLAYWMDRPGWAERVKDAGVDPDQLRHQLMLIGLVSRAEEDRAEEDIVTESRKEPDTGTGDDAAAEAAQKAGHLTPEDETDARMRDMMTRTFYEATDAQPWGGRADIQPRLPTMLSETKTLFFMMTGKEFGEGLVGKDLPSSSWDMGRSKYGGTPSKEERVKGYAPPKPGDVGYTPSLTGGQEYALGRDYKAFLDEYFGNPDKFKNGIELQVAMINDLLTKASDPDTYGALDTWNQTDKKNWLWVEPMFSDTGAVGGRSAANANRMNLMRMTATAGITNRYFAEAVEAGLNAQVAWYRNRGYSEQDIFSRMHKILRQPQRTSDVSTPMPGGMGVQTGDEGGVPSGFASWGDYISSLERNGAEDGGRQPATERSGPGVNPYTFVAPDSRDILEQILNANRLAQEQGNMPKTLGAGVSPRAAMINNLMTFQGMSLQEATDRADNELRGFPVQPTAFTTPGAFEQGVRAGGLAPTLSQPGTMGGGSPTLSEADISAIMAETGLPTDVSTLPYGGTTLTQQEVDDMLRGYPV